MRIGIYGRVSTRDKQEVANQLVQLREFAVKQGWTISREYIDRETGATSDREQFQAMLTESEKVALGVLRIARTWWNFWPIPAVGFPKPSTFVGPI